MRIVNKLPVSNLPVIDLPVYTLHHARSEHPPLFTAHGSTALLLTQS